MAETYTQPDLKQTDDIITATIWNEQIAGSIRFFYAAMSQRATFLHQFATIEAGNDLTMAIDTSQAFNASWWQDTAADGDTFSQSCVLEAGTYTLSVFGKTGSNHGIADIYLDDVLAVDGQDWYSAGTVRNVTKTAEVTVVGNGRHVLKVVINGKHASSTGYKMALCAYALAKTAETEEAD